LFSESGIDDLVGNNWESLTLDLHVTSLVKELGDGLSVWETISDKWVNMLEHVEGGLVDSDE